MKILAIDPGERVGWAHALLVRPDEEKLPENAILTVTGHGITPAKDFVMKLHDAAGDYDVLIYETWRLNAAKAKHFYGSDFPTVQTVGMIRMCGWLHPHVKVVAQGPDLKTTGEKVATDAVREILARLPKSHDDAHDGDALLHLSYYFWKNS